MSPKNKIIRHNDLSNRAPLPEMEKLTGKQLFNRAVGIEERNSLDEEMKPLKANNPFFTASFVLGFGCILVVLLFGIDLIATLLRLK